MIYVFVEVDEHEIANAITNLCCRVPVSMVLAALSGIEIPSIDGKQPCEGAVGGQSGRQMRLRGKICQRFALVRLAICSLNCPLKHPSI